MQAASNNVKNKKDYTSNVAEFDLVMQVLIFNVTLLLYDYISVISHLEQSQFRRFV